MKKLVLGLLIVLVMVSGASAQCVGGISNCPPIVPPIGPADQFIVNQVNPPAPSGFTTRRATFAQVQSALSGQSSAIIDVANASPPLLCNGQDQTANIQALYAAYPAGASLQFHWCKYLFLGNPMPPNNGASSFPTQSSYFWEGVGQAWIGYPSNSTTLPDPPGTVFDLRNPDAKGLMYTFGGNAIMGAQHITFMDGGGGGTGPFVFTTNTKLRFDDVAFLGAAGLCSNTGSVPNRDVFVFGGPATGNPMTSFGTMPNDPNAAYQGYGTSINNVFADRIRRLAISGTFAQYVYITNPHIWICSGNTLYGATTSVISGGAIASAGTGYALNDRYMLTGGTINSGTQIVVTAVDGGGGITGAHVVAPGGYLAAPSNPISIAQQLCEAGCTGTGATFNLSYANTVGAAIDMNGLAASQWHIDGGLLDMGGYYYGIQTANTGAYINTAFDDVRLTTPSVAGVRFLYSFGQSNLATVNSGASPFVAFQDDNAVGGGCSNLNVLIPRSGNAADLACFQAIGNLNVPTSPIMFGTAGMTNEVRILQSTNYLDLFVDGTNGFLTNLGTGGLFFQSLGNGSIFFEGQSSVPIVSLFNGGGVQFNGTLPTLSGSCAVVAGTRVGGNQSGRFTIPSGGCAIGTAVTVTFANGMVNGYACDAHDLTTPTAIFDQTGVASPTTTATFTIRAANAIAGDVVAFKCVGS